MIHKNSDTILSENEEDGIIDIGDTFIIKASILQYFSFILLSLILYFNLINNKINTITI